MLLTFVTCRSFGTFQCSPFAFLRLTNTWLVYTVPAFFVYYSNLPWHAKEAYKNLSVLFQKSVPVRFAEIQFPFFATMCRFIVEFFSKLLFPLNVTSIDVLRLWSHQNFEHDVHSLNIHIEYCRNILKLNKKSIRSFLLNKIDSPSRILFNILFRKDYFFFHATNTAISFM